MTLLCGYVFFSSCELHYVSCWVDGWVGGWFVCFPPPRVLGTTCDVWRYCFVVIRLTYGAVLQIPVDAKTDVKKAIELICSRIGLTVPDGFGIYEYKESKKM